MLQVQLDSRVREITGTIKDKQIVGLNEKVEKLDQQIQGMDKHIKKVHDLEVSTNYAHSEIEDMKTRISVVEKENKRFRERL